MQRYQLCYTPLQAVCTAVQVYTVCAALHMALQSATKRFTVYLMCNTPPTLTQEVELADYVRFLKMLVRLTSKYE